MASDVQRNLSKKSICNITRQLALASDNQRWQAMASDGQRNLFKILVVGYYIVIADAGQRNLKRIFVMAKDGQRWLMAMYYLYWPQVIVFAHSLPHAHLITLNLIVDALTGKKTSFLL